MEIKKGFNLDTGNNRHRQFIQKSLHQSNLKKVKMFCAK